MCVSRSFFDRPAPSPSLSLLYFSVHSALHERALSHSVFAGRGGWGGGGGLWGGGSDREATPLLNPLTAVDLKLKESLLARRLFLVLRSVANFKLQGKDDSGLGGV